MEQQPNQPPLPYESRILSTDTDDEPAYQFPKCSGNMIAGYCIDAGHGSVTPLRWMKGWPIPLKMFGFLTSSIRINRKQLVNVTTYACSKCGYLESFLRA